MHARPRGRQRAWLSMPAAPASPLPAPNITPFNLPVSGAQGKFALCAYATCVPIPGSNPLVAECGCLAFDNVSVGASGSSAILNEEVRRE